LCSPDVVVVIGVNEEGRRRLFWLKVENSESEAFWAEFITSLYPKAVMIQGTPEVQV
jgi:transposase-like protein